jgi:hypothetical protein
MDMQNRSVKVLNKHRSVIEIQSEIEYLQQKLAQAKIEEKCAAYAEKFPNTLYAWDMYISEDEKGTWRSAEKEDITWDGIVFETEDDAVNAAQTLLSELNNERELEGDPDEYTIDTFAIPITELTVEDLEYSNLEHLIPAIIK